MSDRYVHPRFLMDVMDIRPIDRIITHMCVLQERRIRLRRGFALTCTPAWCVRNTAMLNWNKRWQRTGDW